MRCENSPCSERIAQRAACAVAGIDQVGHALGLRQVELAVEEGALREFAGLGAARAPSSRQRCSSSRSTTARRGPAARARPRRCRNAGAGKYERDAWSIASPSRVAKVASVARARRQRRARRALRRMPRAPGPETRTTPMPPRPGAVAIAAMVSRCIMAASIGAAA